jgi:hypothetical protein
MDRLLILLAIFFLLQTSCRQSENNLQHGFDIEKLRKTRALLKKAMLDNETETLNKIYSENYKIVTRKGTLITRSERIDMLKSGRLKYLNLGCESEVSFEIYENIVVVRGVVSSAETEFDGERRKSGPRRFTEIWIINNGNWNQIGRQSTSIVVSAS